MEQTRVAVPPLPPKTRTAPPGSSATVLKDNQVFCTNNGTKTKEHVVKIRIDQNSENSDTVLSDAAASCIRISVNSTDMSTMVDAERPYFFYNPFNCSVMSSGQISPSETLDSGTCSDLDLTPPITVSKKKNPQSAVSVTLIQHKRTSSLTSSADSDDNESSISCDSLNSGQTSPKIPSDQNLPQTLLQDIRSVKRAVTVKSYEERKQEDQKDMMTNSLLTYESDIFYKFHLNEQDECEPKPVKVQDDETFAGYKDLLGDGDASATIRSAKGTVRGVKNRVRAGIATFLQINSVEKNWKEKDGGNVVVYTTTMGVIRDTYQACMKVKQIMRTLLVKFVERDVFMSSEYQSEIKERMRCEHILVPQVFVDGQHVGDAETIERLNESGELRRILKPFKSMDACTTCKVCGGYRLLPCQVCNGSKKSVHRNHFTAEFVALKCMNCDEVGLVKCPVC